jgi:PKD repeat protein
MRTRLAVAVAGALALTAGCTMKDQKAPPLTGPSEFSTSIALTASPDAIHQDGASQSLITATARDANGQPIRNAVLRSEIRVGGITTDFGALSAKSVVTGSDGKATFVYTAPPSVSSQVSVDTNTIVDIFVTPSGTDFNNSVTRSVAIRLLPVGIVGGPNAKPVPDFTFSPSSPSENVKIFFDASSSTDSDGQIVSYSWKLSDGDSGSGVTISRAFSAAGTYSVTLTVTDDRGDSASITKQVTVSAATGISASFTTSPSAPAPNQQVFFNASASTPSAGHVITSYAWDFGDGRAGSGVTTSHAYERPETYTVTLVVTDDAGKIAVASQSVTIASSTPVSASRSGPR